LLLALLVSVAVASASVGCTSSSARQQDRTGAAGVHELTIQAAGPRQLLDQAPIKSSPEPYGDVSDGTFLAIVHGVDPGLADPSILIDFVSAQPAPHTDSLYWNRVAHTQRLPVPGDPHGPPFVVAMRGSKDALQVVSFKQFADRVNADPRRADRAYWVLVDGGRAVSIWEAWFP
jgi:hypothetical protein